MRGLTWKESEVDLLTDLARKNPVIGVASIHEIPARQLQSIRRSLRGKVDIRVSKRTLVELAFANSGKEKLKELQGKLGGEMALLFTEMNPFRLFKYLEGLKVRCPAKPGHRPPEDVWVPKGETSFPPGPIVSQLQKVGIPARIERGKVVILEDTLFVKAGEEIDREKADILSRLEIQPMKIGLDVGAVYEDETIFDRSVLDVDTDQLRDQISMAATQAFNLAFNSGYFTDLTIIPMIQSAYAKARSLSLAAGIPTKETIGDLLSMGQQGMLSLAAAIARSNPDALDEELRARVEVVPEGPKEEAKPPDEEEDKAPEEEEQKDEEGPGLGALFG